MNNGFAYFVVNTSLFRPLDTKIIERHYDLFLLEIVFNGYDKTHCANSLFQANINHSGIWVTMKIVMAEIFFWLTDLVKILAQNMFLLYQFL